MGTSLGQEKGLVDTTSEKKRMILSTLGFVWVLAVFIFYFRPVGHAFHFIWSVFDGSSYPSVPFSESLSIWIGFLSVFAASLWVICMVFSCGKRLKLFLGLTVSDPWVEKGLSLGLGIVFFDLFWVGAGLVRLWYPWVWGCFFLIFCIPAVLDIVGWISLFAKDHPTKVDWAWKEPAFWLLGAGFFYFTFAVLQDLSPETFYDSSVYHLAIPQDWFLNHGIVELKDNFFSHFPFGAECFYLNGFVLQGTESAKMLHVFCFGVCALAAGGWARELAGKRAGWMAAGLILTLPIFSINTWSTQVEGFMALALLLFFYALECWKEKGFPRWVFASGLFAGLSLSVKYTAVLGIASALFVLLFQRPTAFRQEPWKAVGWFFLGLGVVLGPWVLKNLFFTGNPAFPYFSDLFGGYALHREGLERLLREQHAWMVDHWWQWPFLPWKLTMSDPNAYDFCGPVVLAFVPLGLAWDKNPSTIRTLGSISLLFFVLGLCVTHLLKFMVAAFVLLYLWLACTLAGRPVWGKVAAWMMLLSSVLCFAYLAGISSAYSACSGLWWGRQTPQDFLQNSGKLTPYYSMAKWTNENLPSRDRLLLAGDARGLYYDHPFVSDSVFDEQVMARLARQEKDPSAIAERLKEMGVDDLVVNGVEGMRVSADYHHYDLTPEEWEKLDVFIQHWTQLVYFQDLQGVYRIQPQPLKDVKQEQCDLLLFFTPSASRFVWNLRHQQWDQAQQNLQETLRIYPFSRFWKEQAVSFEKMVKGPSHE